MIYKANSGLLWAFDYCSLDTLSDGCISEHWARTNSTLGILPFKCHSFSYQTFCLSRVVCCVNLNVILKTCLSRDTIVSDYNTIQLLYNRLIMVTLGASLLPFPKYYWCVTGYFWKKKKVACYVISYHWPKNERKLNWLYILQQNWINPTTFIHSYIFNIPWPRKY